MSEFKWELPMWCEKYWQVEAFGIPDLERGTRIVRFKNSDIRWHYNLNGSWCGEKHNGAKSLRNGLMGTELTNIKDPYVTVNHNGLVYVWNNKEEALADQRECGGHVVDLAEAIRLGAVVEQPKTKTGWLNVDSDNAARFFETREEADKSRWHDRIACVPFTFDEGAGL